MSLIVVIMHHMVRPEQPPEGQNPGPKLDLGRLRDEVVRGANIHAVIGSVLSDEASRLFAGYIRSLSAPTRPVPLNETVYGMHQRGVDNVTTAPTTARSGVC